MRYPNNIKRLQSERGWTIDQAAEAVGISRGGYLKIQRGENRLTTTTIEQAARAFGVSRGEIVADDAAKVPVMGLASAGSDTVTFTDAQGPFDEVDAPDWATDKTVAVQIRGTSLGRLLDGWIAFYDDRRDPPDESLHGRVCICGLTDGRVVIKKLRQGSAKARYHLESENEPTMFDVDLDWAAAVREMRPR